MSNPFSRLIGAAKKGIDFLTALAKYAATLRPFVIQAATELEQLIPDSGMGNIKLAAFDQALKIFVASSSQIDAPDVEEGAPIWIVAHWLLETYLSAQQARRPVVGA
jgi:hypothetical protein